MKYIFDFDDVLFNNTKMFKKHMYACFAEVGLSQEKALEYYQEVREKEFSLQNFITELLVRNKKELSQGEEIYKKIMSKCKDFINEPLVNAIKKLGKDNCFLVTNGEKKFQEDKIKNSGIGYLFSEIHIVSESKKEIIYEICEKYKDEKIFFTDDKIKFFEDIDLAKCPNLQNILYTI